MSLPQEVSAAAARPRFAGAFDRAAGIAAAHPIALGVVLLLLCGWKFTFGLDRALDIDPHHEAMYLGYMLGIYPGGTPPEYSPVYVWFYALEHFFQPDIIQVFYIQMTLLTVLLPVALFVFLMVRRVPFFVALPSAFYVLIAAANLPVRPKPMHLALIVMFLGLAVFVKLGERPARWGFMLVLCAALSLIRPELLYALIFIGLYCAYLIVRERQLWRHWLAACALAALGIATLYWALGVPLFGERSMLAIAFHFGANYSSWHHTGDVPFTEDFETIFARVFGHPTSIPGAFLANPGAFLHSMLTNTLHLPKALGGMWLAHFNVLLPRYLPWTFIEAGFVALAAIGGAVALWRRRAAEETRFSVTALVAGVRRVAAASPETICLVLFLIPYASMMVIIYPRYHYATAVGVIIGALALTALAARPATPVLKRAHLLLLPLLLAMTPSIGSVGARIDERPGSVVAAPLTTLAEARYLQTLHPQSIVHIFESTDPGVSPYAGPMYRSTSEMAKPRGVAAFLADNDISVVIDDERLRDFQRFGDDPEWAQFRRAPQDFGFAAEKLPGTGAVVYVKQSLLATAAAR
jgi:hypothetical protein